MTGRFSEGPIAGQAADMYKAAFGISDDPLINIAETMGVGPEEFHEDQETAINCEAVWVKSFRNQVSVLNKLIGTVPYGITVELDVLTEATTGRPALDFLTARVVKEL